MPIKNDELKQLRSVIERVVRDGRTVARMDNSAHEIFPIAVSSVEGLALQKWITSEQVATTIEIGLAYGISALFACEGLLMNAKPNSKHVVVDPFQTAGFKNCGLQLLEEGGVKDLIEFYEEESQTLLPKFLSEGRHFELAFVDGSVFFDRVFLDLIYLGRLVKPGGIVFVDDYQLPAIAKALTFCVANLGWISEEISQPDAMHQWAVLRTPRAPVKRTFRDFVDF